MLAQHNYDSVSVIYSNNNNVGIGTSSPSGSISSNQTGLHILNDNVSYLSLESTAGSGKKYTMYSSTAGSLVFWDASSSTARGIIDSNGNWGIGTTDPDQGTSPDLQRKLLVNGGITLKSGGKLSYDPNYYLHAYSEYNSSVSEARFLNYGYYGHRWETRAGIGMVLLGNNGNVGIGTTDPDQGTSPDLQRKLLVNGGITLKSGGKLSYDPNYYLHAYSEYNSSVSEARFLNYGYYGHRWETRAGIGMVLLGNNGNVGIGTPDPLSKLSVAGQIRATEVKVLADITVPDYVFEPDYDLRTLKETKEYITENKHLPEIPSAAEIGENGIDLGDMNMRLLKKIEELTLYLIEQSERVEKLEKEVSTLKSK